MNITLCSSFRNSTSYLARYFCQIRALNNLLDARGDSLSLILGEGDSTDGTRAHLGLASMLVEEIDCRIVDVSHGGPVFGSVVDAQRFKQLACVCNRIWAHIPADSDVVIWCESDLTVEASTLIALIDRLKDYPAVAPMVMHKTNPGLYQGDGPFFYDIWGHRRNRVHFTNQPPYHPDIDGGMLQLDSAGSCLVMNGALARHVRFTEDAVIVGMCAQIYALGGSVWLDSSLSVEHD